MTDPQNASPPIQPSRSRLQGSLELFDINILPERHRRKKITLAMVLPWLLLLVLAGSFYPVLTLGLDAQASFREAQAELVSTRAVLEISQNNTLAVQELQAEISAAEEQKAQILASYGGVQLQIQRRFETLQAVLGAAPEGITWQLITWHEAGITLQGVGQEYSSVINYRDALADLDELEEVEINSVELLVAEPDAEAESSEASGDESAEPAETVQNPESYNFNILAVPAEEVSP